MTTVWKESLNDFLAVAGLAEMPMGMTFTDREPDSPFTKVKAPNCNGR